MWSLTRGGHFQEVPNIAISLGNFWYFGKLVANESRSLTRGGHYLVPLFQNGSFVQNYLYENEFCQKFCFQVRQTHLNKWIFAHGLILKQRHKVTWKWPIFPSFNLSSEHSVKRWFTLYLQHVHLLKVVKAVYFVLNTFARIETKQTWQT